MESVAVSRAKRRRARHAEAGGEDDGERRGQRALHDVHEEAALDAGAVRLEAEDEAGVADAEEVDERHLDGLEGVRREGDAERGEPHGEERLGEEERGGALEVVDGAAALGHHGGHAREVVVHEHELGDVARRVGSRRHGDGAVGLLEREHVVHAVARHGDRVPAPLEGLDELALLLRGHAAEHVVAVDGGVELGRGVEGRGVHVGAPRRASPTTCAMEETVRGSSPEMTLSATPCSLK